MRVLSINTWKNDGDVPMRWARLARALRAFKPDILLLQEAFASQDTGESVAHYLAGALGCHLAFAPAREKERAHRGGTVASVSGLAILSSSEATGIQRIRLPTTDVGGERIALAASVNWREFVLRVACVHFSHIRGESEVREAQMRRVLESLGGAWTQGPCLIGGDFNTTVDALQPTLDELSPGSCWRDILGELGCEQPTVPLPPRPSRPGRRIDNLILIEPRGAPALELRDGGLALNEPEPGQPRLFPSDHAAVWVELGIRS
jgi:endonuclease/exonuclease/phosphatase family metal-dependent hydrolase